MQEAEEETYIVKGLNPCLDEQLLLKLKLVQHHNSQPQGT